jgi:two-component system LytT family sensor kinase
MSGVSGLVLSALSGRESTIIFRFCTVCGIYLLCNMRRKIFAGIAHSALWLAFLGFPFIFFYEDKEFEISSVLGSPFYWLFLFSYLLLFYLNYYFLIPRLYLKKWYNWYALSLFLLFVVFYFEKPFILMFSHYLKARNIKLPDYPPLKADTLACIIFVIVVSSGLALQVVKQWQASEKRALVAEAEKANAELSFLKAQINPHFLFNTLNNIYSLSIEQHPDTSASIMRLSNLMRYITDDATRDYVSLDEEIACITDFISLQKLRHGDNVKVDFSVSGNTREIAIAPWILMTYIENVFKYGISSHEAAPITIRLTAEADRISFFCQNKIFATPRVTERTGVGLVNTEQRLKHLYPDKHSLQITRENDLYTVALALQT